MRFPRPALYGVGGVGLAGLVSWTILSHWPEGDPDGARRAAAVWRRLADRIDTNSSMSGRVAKIVWTEQPSEGSEAFRRAWTGEAGGRPPGGLAGYPAQVSAYCRRVAEACEAYAEAIEVARRGIWALVVSSYLQYMFACSWPFIGPGPAAMAKWLSDRVIKKMRASILLRVLDNTVTRIAVEKLSSYTLGSATFALGDEAISLGTRAAFGVDQGSVSDNAMSTLKDFAACMVFFGVWDVTKVGRVGKLFPANDLGDFASFYVGSLSYTVAYKLENGETGWDALPTWDQFLAKLLVGTAQRSKTPPPAPAT
ncbi:WXG100-like domain-containing protein [Sphaerisporangium fuscum]|uniref:WXG100-like domain-containing protein n=1 Tax=Sphaerisporangium fuscum TaxID=2835868 RepID=UPI001BDCB6EE|nr:hypothetical protein [Sphaerisporangium fuscum]